MKSKPVYLNIRLNYETANMSLVESIKVLPGVNECRRMYPDDPALFNILLAVVEPDSSEELIRTIASCESVEFVDVISKPQPR